MGFWTVLFLILLAVGITIWIMACIQESKRIEERNNRPLKEQLLDTIFDQTLPELERKFNEELKRRISGK